LLKQAELRMRTREWGDRGKKRKKWKGRRRDKGQAQEDEEEEEHDEAEEGGARGIAARARLQECAAALPRASSSSVKRVPRYKRKSCSKDVVTAPLGLARTSTTCHTSPPAPSSRATPPPNTTPPPPPPSPLRGVALRSAAGRSRRGPTPSGQRRKMNQETV
jgi:hypothetical protein